ncbi:helix-turn-helix domain-containing protein [Salmonella enterica subsp. enterica serovar Senftenberg]|nr:helix-turn-helix domain-containing protein [Salmonella enterica subsp. enterica serovar Senftenberg]
MTKQDCHPADIIAALHKRGTSMAAVSREAGWPLPRWRMRFHVPAERRVADCSRTQRSPCKIWPSRYEEEGELRQPKIRSRRAGYDYSRRQHPQHLYTSSGSAGGHTTASRNAVSFCPGS